MKKRLSSLILVASLMFSSGLVSANSINVTVDNVEQVYPQAPIQQNGTTLVPLRGIFESLGATVSWDASSQTISATKGAKTVKLTLNQKTAYVNGTPIKLAVAPKSVNGSTMVPLRFISEALGATVAWDASTKTVRVSSKDQKSSSQGGRVVSSIVWKLKKSGNGYYQDGNVQIRVLHGDHTYGSNSQIEYDAVMKIVVDAVSKFDSFKVGDASAEGLLSEGFELYVDGAKGKTRSEVDPKSKTDHGLFIAERQWGALRKNGVGTEAMRRAIKTGFVANSLLSQDHVKTVLGPPRSAYDALVNNVTDCDPDAQVRSAVFDALGYNTAVVGGIGHADVIVQIEGKWYRNLGTSFDLVDPAKVQDHDTSLISIPTFGTSTLK